MAPRAGLAYEVGNVVYGVGYAGILLVGAWGGPWLGLLSGALVGGLSSWIFGWEMQFALVEVVIGFVPGLLARRGWMRSPFGAVLVAFLTALIRVALVMALRAYLYNDTFFDQTWALGFLGGVVVAGLLVWLLARLVPRAWLARLPHGNRLR